VAPSRFFLRTAWDGHEALEGRSRLDDRRCRCVGASFGVFDQEPELGEGCCLFKGEALGHPAADDVA